MRQAQQSVDKTGVLVGIAVMLLAPKSRSLDVVQRGDITPPRSLLSHLDKLGKLNDHPVAIVVSKVIWEDDVTHVSTMDKNAS